MAKPAIAGTRADESQPQRVLLVDDDPALRRLIRRVIERVPDFEVVAEAGDGKSALQLALADPPDIVLTDITMPEVDGVALTRRLLDVHPHVRVIALTGAEPGKALSDMIRNGAVGYLVKTSSIDEMISALHAVRRGLAVLAPEATSVVLNDLVEHYRAEHQRAESLLALEAMKRNFINVISHELRTPVTIIKGGIQTLRRRGEQLDRSRQAAFLESIEGQCVRLQRMIDQVLLVSQIEKSPTGYRGRTVDLAVTLTALVKDLPSHHRDRISVDLQHGHFSGPSSIAQIFGWVLDNALAFSSGHIHIRGQERNPVQVHLEIIDEGVGMSRELIRRVLDEPFTQQDASTTRQRDGLGLSLFAARQVLESLGGSLEIDSALNQGTKVSLYFDRSPDTVSKESKTGARAHV